MSSLDCGLSLSHLGCVVSLTKPRDQPGHHSQRHNDQSAATTATVRMETDTWSSWTRLSLINVLM